MPARRHFITVSGEPPNGGVPPGVAFIAKPPPPEPLQPPPAYAVVAPPAMLLAAVSPPPKPATLPPPPPPGPAALLVPVAIPIPPPAPAPAPKASTGPFECPGLRLHGERFVHKGIAYLFPRRHVLIHFFHTGTRPFERPQGPSSHHAQPVPAPTPSFIAIRVPTSLSISDLIVQLGAPASSGDRYGVTECIEVGGGAWAKGRTWTVGGDGSAKTTLADAGWGKEVKGEKEGNVVWLATYDREKHGKL